MNEKIKEEEEPGVPAEFSYDTLVEGYYQNLNDTLRNFRGGPGFLESWAHDENHSRSILEIFDLAAQHEVHSVKLTVKPEIADSLDFDWLVDEIGTSGGLEVQRTLSESVLYFRTRVINAVYIKKLERASTHIEYEAPPRTAHSFTAVDEGRLLCCTIDEKGFVIAATHQGAKGLYVPLLDRLCSLLINRPLQEGAEHAVIRLENSLRDEVGEIKGQGIVLPQNADPIFQTCLTLLREIFRNYLETTHEVLERNVWQDPLPESWLKTPHADRCHSIEIALRKLCEERKLIGRDVRVVGIKHEKRFILAYQNTTQKNFAHALIGLERDLRRNLGVEIELQLESLEDKNKRENRTHQP